MEILAEDSGTIRCICRFDHDDNFTIQCERCNAWQHATCVNISDEKSVPEHYLCPQCAGKMSEVNAQKAREHQRQVRKRRLEYQKLMNSQGDDLKAHKTRRKRDDEEQSPAEENLAPVSFNPRYYNVHTTSNKWSEQATKAWKKWQEANQEVPLPLTNKDSVHSSAVKVVRNERSKSKWVFGQQAGGFVCVSNVPAHKLLGEVNGEVFTREEYCSDPLNQFEALGCPKQGVFFVPGLPLVIDSRRRGSDAVFIQRSSTPNACLVAKADKKGNLRLFICSMKSLKAGTEITLGWHWAKSHPITPFLGLETAPEETKYFLWLLGRELNEIGKARVPLNSDEDWGFIKTLIIPKKEIPTEIHEEPGEDPGVALASNVWQPATAATPLPKKRLSLADYRKKRT